MLCLTVLIILGTFPVVSGNCSDPTPEHGSINYGYPDGEYPEGLTVAFFCDDDYVRTPLSTSASTCTAQGSWHPTPPTCRPITCDALSLSNGEVTYSKYEVNGEYPVRTRASFSCNYGYRRTGPYSITCNTHGTYGFWSGQLPTCSLLTCVVLSLENGAVTYNKAKVGPRYPHDTRASFSCNSGYCLHGHESTFCKLGGWRDGLPTCTKESSSDGCFPSASRVTLENGRSVPMSELQEGDRVQTVSSTGAFIYSEVRSFLKKEHNTMTQYRSIETVNKTLMLTGNHLIYSRNQYTKQFDLIYADKLTIGEEVLVEGNNDLTPAKVINISIMIMQGGYVPLTTNGKIMVDGVLASCFADFQHDLAYSIMIPMQRFSEVMDWIFGIETGFPVFVSTTRQLGKLLLPESQCFGN